MSRVNQFYLYMFVCNSLYLVLIGEPVCASNMVVMRAGKYEISQWLASDVSNGSLKPMANSRLHRRDASCSSCNEEAHAATSISDQICSVAKILNCVVRYC